MGDAASGPRLAWLAAFVELDRFAVATVTVATPHLARVWVDGEQVAEKKKADGVAETKGKKGEARSSTRAPGEAKGDVPLHAGKHLLLVAVLLDPDGPPPWSVAARLEVPSARRAEVAVSTEPDHGVTIPNLLDPPQVAEVAVSADGTLVAVTLEQPAVPSDDRTTWVEIVSAADGSPVHTVRPGGAVRGFAWAPAGHGYAYRTSEKGEATLWIGDLESGRLRPLLSREGLSSHRWSADGASLFLAVDAEDEAAKKQAGDKHPDAVRVRSLADRWAGFRDLGSLYQVSAEDGRRLRRLTAGPRSVRLLDVAPDGRHLLVARTRYQLERPFSTGELAELDLQTLEATPITEVTWLRDAVYSPHGGRLLVVAGPSAFDGAGRDVAEGTIPNEYDNQAYLYERASGEVTALTRHFDPAVDSAAWSPADGAVYLRVTEGTYGRLYRWQPAAAGDSDATTAFERLDTAPADVVDGFALARAAGTVAWTGSAAQRPAAAYVMAAASATSQPLLDPAADVFDQVRYGRVEDATYTTADGVEVPGRLYYPLHFDPSETYPLIVYYYGGVVPTERAFDGRYPKNLWASRGYAVYVPQPSGAVGWGQTRSAVHVNDWGKVIVDEILGGVDAVLAAHPFLDGSKVGCFGGSYGGFTTLRLITESDRFAAAISHAGISGIASYWGEGWWGYLYMAAAAADSYPWNRRDLFVDRSPLFKADRVTTPLLLLHGTADPNVPPGESEQMFTALRLLGKEVEYVKIEGEAHWILTYPKRVLWWETILAWFDKQLQDDPAAWDDLWGGELDRSGP
jgi:dipeptidyl aminopeptidase/acylaminoacyl peptidase